MNNNINAFFGFACFTNKEFHSLCVHTSNRLKPAQLFPVKITLNIFSSHNRKFSLYFLVTQGNVHIMNGNDRVVPIVKINYQSYRPSTSCDPG